ncbi:hypothetical protein ZOSMA_107G00300 [Zostera marina]|uniref:trehalose-phosphatase n=1 Tax=Zostera marina TaxID=29655 RepID=A0A0K9Q416_ZOSMR|nr:hypothetical protein ZOSMA_107G00300 [Zostera marina]
MINDVYSVLVEKTKAIKGSMVENDKFCVSVHYRCVEEKTWAVLVEEVKSVLKYFLKLHLTQDMRVGTHLINQSIYFLLASSFFSQIN